MLPLFIIYSTVLKNVIQIALHISTHTIDTKYKRNIECYCQIIIKFKFCAEFISMPTILFDEIHLIIVHVQFLVLSKPHCNIIDIYIYIYIIYIYIYIYIYIIYIYIYIYYIYIYIDIKLFVYILAIYRWCLTFAFTIILQMTK